MTHSDPAIAAAERFLRALTHGELDAAGAAVSPAVPPGAMSPARLGEVWAQLVGHLGQLTDLHAPDGTTTERGRRVADFDARFARSEVTLRVVLDDADRVVGFWAT